MRTVPKIALGLCLSLALAQAQTHGDPNPAAQRFSAPPPGQLQSPLTPPPPNTTQLKSCLAKVTPFKDSCISVLGTCTARTVGGGARALKTPIVASAGTPCSARVALQKQACAQGIFPKDFKAGDIHCTATQF